MASDFIKFPHTPHLTGLPSKPSRADRVLSNAEVKTFLRGEVIIEEKVDGANLGISVSPENHLVVQNRGAFIERTTSEQFKPLWGWLNIRADELTLLLGQNLILFGEWCFAVHSVRYSRLPDWFIGFDIYDRHAGRYYSSDRRDRTLSSLQLFTVPRIGKGHYSVSQLMRILEEEHSSFGTEKLEGLYLRRDSEDWLEQRAKIVRDEFTQSIDAHWSSRPLSRNVIAR